MYFFHLLYIFSTQYFIVPDFGFDLIGTNSSNGVVGKLQQNLIDLGLSPMAVTKERIGVFDQTVAFATVKITIIFRHPKSGGTRNLFLQPFDSKIWSLIGAVLLVSTGILSVILYIKQRKSRFHCQCTLAVFGIFCLQSYSGRISTIPSRITLFTVILFSILLYQFYSCFIIGYLLVLPPKNIRTLEQLLASNLKLSVENISYNHDFLKVLVRIYVCVSTTNDFFCSEQISLLLVNYMKERYFRMILDSQMLVWEYLWSNEADMPFTVTILMEIHI